MRSICVPLTVVALLTQGCSRAPLACVGHGGNQAAAPVVELFQAPIGLQGGIGRGHEAVSTSSEEAQAYYDQGLAFLYSYDWIHAGRSFNEALRRDPNLGMAYLGLSYASSGFADQEFAETMVQRAST